MPDLHFKFWPKHIGKSLPVPRTTLYDNLVVSARRFPDKDAMIYYGAHISYQKLLDDVDALAAYLLSKGITKGDRVVLYMQNSPQFVIGYYAILRANAVVVPVNPMNIKSELEFYIQDTEARMAIVGQELLQQIEPTLKTTTLEHIIVGAYSDYAGLVDYDVPDVVEATSYNVSSKHVTSWMKALSSEVELSPLTTTYSDMAVLPYTSGTTGRPKGCIHTHETLQANTVGTCVWSRVSQNSVSLATLPFFHVTGMEHSMNAPIYCGGTMVIMTRWDRATAGQLIEHYKCTHWVNISTMVVDFLSNPNLANYDLSSLGSIGGGGAPLPKAVGEKLYQLTGIHYAEGYGLSETIAQTHFNPPDRPKLQCMGVPSFDVDARIIDPVSQKELGMNEEGEVIVNGPQVFKGYWNLPQETKNAFVTLDGKPFFRTGDIGKYDEEGYFFMVDRVKRMINASGFKVWPTEIESILYKHPAVEQACVIGVPDERRGESVKAFVVLNNKDRGKVSKEDIIQWSKEHMAAYKYPREVEFVDKLPMSGSGKILWRKLQEQEQAKIK